MNNKEKINIFISYAHDDEAYFEIFSHRLGKNLKTSSKFDYSVWDDRNIHAGSLWDDEIKENLATADLAILLVSDSFIASDYIKSKEFGLLIKEFPKTLIIPVMLAPCNFTDWDDLAKRQFFMPSGEDYGKGTVKGFTFSDLIRFRETDGKEIPNPNIRRYINDLREKIEISYQHHKKKVLTENSENISSPKTPSKENNSEIVPKAHALFTGRIAELAEIKSTFEANKIFSLTGIGGIGKTSVLARFIEKLDTQYQDKIIWFSFTGENSFDAFVQNSPFFAILEGNKNEKDKFIAFLSKANENKSIIVWENFHSNSDTDFDRFIQFAKGRLNDAKLIVISRDSIDTIKNIKIDVLKEILDYAKKLLKDIYTNLKLTESELTKICQYVNGHPLALELALNLCQSNSLNKIINKLSKYKTQGDKLSKRIFEEILEQGNTTEEEKSFLYQFSIFQDAVSEPILEELFGSEIFYETIPDLCKKHLLKFEQGQYSTHPLVREFCYAKLDKHNKKELHQKAADFLMEKRGKKLKIQEEEYIFHHLAGAENSQKIIHLLTKQGEIHVKQSFYELLSKILTFLNPDYLQTSSHYMIQGTFCREKKNFDTALDYFQKSLKINLKTGDNDGVARSYHQIGGVYSEKSFTDYNLGIALINHEKSLEFNLEIGNKEGIASCYNNIGNIYFQKDFTGYNLITSLVNHKKSLEFSIEAKHKEGIASCYNNIGYIYFQKDFIDYNLVKSLNNYEKSLKFSSKIENKERIANCYQHIGYIYFCKDFIDYNLVKSLDNYEKSLKFNLEIENKEDIANSYHHIGGIYYILNKYKVSLLNWFQAYLILKQLESSNLQLTKSEIIGLRQVLGRTKFLDYANQALVELNTEQQRQINLAEFLGRIPLIKPKNKYKKTDIITVLYLSKTEIKEGKYKKFEKDIKNGKCVII